VLKRIYKAIYRQQYVQPVMGEFTPRKCRSSFMRQFTGNSKSSLL
jgi:hypothetical protein